MAKLNQQLIALENQFKALYNPKTAVGHTELLTIKAKIDEIKSTLEDYEECGDCDGWGMIECCECGQDRTCDTCAGGGLLDRQEPKCQNCH